MHIRLSLLLLLETACGSSAPATHSPTPPRDQRASRAEAVAAPAEVSAGLDAPAEGPCGGLAALPLALGTQALRGRLRLPSVVIGQDAETRPHNIMSAPPPVEASEVLWLRSSDDESAARMAILVEELFRMAAQDPVDEVADYASEGWQRTALGRGAVATPTHLEDEGGDVRLLQDYVVDADSLVIRVTFVTSPEVARTGGCAALARRIAEAIEPGERRLELGAGSRTLEGRLVIDLPARTALVAEQGPDFTVYRLYPIVPLSAVGGSLGIYIGGFPSFQEPQGAQTRTTHMLGHDVTWYDTRSDDRTQTEALVHVEQGAYMHVFYGARDPGTLAGLRGAAESLHLAPAP